MVEQEPRVEQKETERVETNQVAEAMHTQVDTWTLSGAMESMRNSSAMRTMASGFLILSVLGGSLESANAQSFDEDVETSAKAYNDFSDLRKDTRVMELREIEDNIRDLKKAKSDLWNDHNKDKVAIANTPDPEAGQPSKDARVKALTTSYTTEVANVEDLLEQLQKEKEKAEKKIRRIEKNKKLVGTVLDLVQIIPEGAGAGRGRGGSTTERPR